jgi:hypothetical protein
MTLSRVIVSNRRLCGMRQANTTRARPMPPAGRASGPTTRDRPPAARARRPLRESRQQTTEIAGVPSPTRGCPAPTSGCAADRHRRTGRSTQTLAGPDRDAGGAGARDENPPSTGSAARGSKDRPAAAGRVLSLWSSGPRISRPARQTAANWEPAPPKYAASTWATGPARDQSGGHQSKPRGKGSAGAKWESTWVR